MVTIKMTFFQAVQPSYCGSHCIIQQHQGIPPSKVPTGTNQLAEPKGTLSNHISDIQSEEE